jgi:hypothetical protein
MYTKQREIKKVEFIKNYFAQCQLAFENDNNNHKSVHSKELIRIARIELDYSKYTISHDIFISLKKLYIKDFFTIEAPKAIENNMSVFFIDNVSLNNDELEIAKIQKTIIYLGYQWQEHLFNNSQENCIIKLTQKKESNYFTKHRFGDKMFGKHKRIDCWKLALNDCLKYIDTNNLKI